MDLFINGELVAHWNWLEDIPDMPDGLQVMFDSSHFPNGSTVTVEFDAYFWDGGETHASGFSVVRNNAAFAARHDFETPQKWPTLDLVQAFTDACNYTRLPRLQSLGWDSDAYLALCDAPANVFYTITHGVSGPDRLTSDYDEIDPNGTDDQLFIYPPQVWVHRVAAIGAGGLPPYNPSGVPPVNIAVTNACGSGLSNVFAEAMLVPYENAYGKWCENQSELSWTDPFLHGPALPYALDDLWSSFAEGYCADQARVDTAEAYNRT